MNKILQEAFDNITTYAVDENGKLYIDEFEEYDKSCDLVKKALDENDRLKDIHSLSSPESEKAKLIVLEIIINKKVNIQFIYDSLIFEKKHICSAVVYYNGNVKADRKLTEDEFESIKEMLL